jgi:hypothetical protein
MRTRRLHGTGAISKMGGRWRIRWREGDRRRSAMFATREKAEAALAKVVMELARQLRPGHAAS